MSTTRTVTLTDVTLYGVEAGSGHRYHFTIDDQEVYIDSWATENSGGRDTYGEDGDSVVLDEEVEEAASALIDAFDTYFDEQGELQALMDRLVAEARTKLTPTTVEVEESEPNEVPDDYEVKVLGPDDPATARTTCGSCGRSWDDAIVTSMTPTPAARCPFEYYH